MAPGVIGGHIEVAVVWQVLVQVLAQYLSAHPGVVALTEDIAQSVFARGVVRIGERAELKQSPFLGTLAGSDGDRAGGSAK